MTATILWRRLDVPGHDSCRLIHMNDAWRLEGTAVFRQGVTTASLSYMVDCDGEWRTCEGTVHGWIGAGNLELRVTRSGNGIWTLNDQKVAGLENCADLDFGFTPATNLLQLRRMALQPGQTTDLSVAWLDVQTGTLRTLHQRYERRNTETYWYEAAQFGYSALLQVNPLGFVESYPNLWQKEPD